MGSYRSEDEALIGLARQLADAYGEARRREDQDFACDSIAEFLHEYRVEAPSEALLAMLDLPLTAETYPLVDEAQTILAGRGPAVVELLLEAVLGEVYDPDGPAPERAAETLDLMDRRDAVQGLIEVICGRAGDDVKDAAVDGLVALGAFAEPRLAAVLDDPRGGEWARSAVFQIRRDAEHPDALEDYATGEDRAPDDPGELFAGDDADADGDAAEAEEEDGAAAFGDGEEDEEEDEDAIEDVEAGDDQAAGGDEVAAGDDQAPVEGEPGVADPGAGAPAGPDKQRVDDAYDAFLRRYERESGGDSTPS